MPIDLFGTETAAPTAGRVHCDPDGYAHISTAGLYLCRNCRRYHHLDGYSRRVECPHPPAPPRRWDDPAEDELAEPCQKCPPATYHDDPDDCPEAVTDCTECETAHRALDGCPREWCDDCDDWHDRDRWGSVECPGWYCNDCDGYHDYDEGCPRPSYDGCCDAPQQQFTIRNDGQPPLASDTRAPVTLPAGVISDEGVREIQRYLLRMARGSFDERGLVNVAYEIQDALGSQWQTKTGNYTKRLSRYAYQQHQVKITPEVLSQVGCIASDHSKAVSFDVDVTRNLNRPPGDFYHEDSCWWQSYSESRCALKTNGGFGLRSFGSYGNVSGRIWVMPLRKTGAGLVPTFDTMTPDAFIVFNGYGDLGGYTGARIMAAMAGWTYAKISFECEPMYVNAGGYLIAPEQTVQACKSLNLTVRPHADLNEMELANAA